MSAISATPTIAIATESPALSGSRPFRRPQARTGDDSTLRTDPAVADLPPVPQIEGLIESPGPSPRGPRRRLVRLSQFSARTPGRGTSPLDVPAQTVTTPQVHPVRQEPQPPDETGSYPRGLACPGNRSRPRPSWPPPPGKAEVPASPNLSRVPSFPGRRTVRAPWLAGAGPACDHRVAVSGGGSRWSAHLSPPSSPRSASTVGPILQRRLYS